MRGIPAEKVNEELLQGDPQTKGWNRRDAASLTLIGYKGGALFEQINQDRALVVSPFYVPCENKKSNPAKSGHRILIAAFDGHAARGELVSEYAVQNLPMKLAQKLQQLLPHHNKNNNKNSNNKNNWNTANPQDGEERQEATVRALQETFVELDQTAPADPSGGCTASVILLQDDKLFIANAGDSRSFIVAYRPSTKKTQVVYISREDKPSLAEERARVEAMGGQVYIPMRGTSRVVYQDPITGAPSGLAMSRSIGDWAAGKLGVIPDPIVDVLAISDIVHSVMKREPVRDDESSGGGDFDDDDVYIFGVAATDGLLDYLAVEQIAQVLAGSLFETGASHPISACEWLIFSAAHGWQEDKQGRYRDDIAIAVSTLRTPQNNNKK